MKKKSRAMNPEQAQAVLFEVRSILERVGLCYFLILGTCLGVVREGRIIAHDIDIDIGAGLDDLRPLTEAIASGFTEAGFDVRAHREPVEFTRAFSCIKDGIKVDLAGFFAHGAVRYCPSGAEDYCLVYPAEYFDELEAREAYGLPWPVPSPAEQYLAFHYGNDWRTPNPKWRPQDGPARKYGYFRTVKG